MITRKQIETEIENCNLTAIRIRNREAGAMNEIHPHADPLIVCLAAQKYTHTHTVIERERRVWRTRSRSLPKLSGKRCVFDTEQGTHIRNG